MWNKLSVEAFERAFSGAVTFPLVGIFPSGVFTTKAQALEAIIYEYSFFLNRAFVGFSDFDEAPFEPGANPDPWQYFAAQKYIGLGAEFEYS